LKSAAHGVRSRIVVFDVTADDINLGGRQSSKEGSQSSGSLKLCRANVEMGGLPLSET
jgi:hypothetical protein